MTDPTQQPPQDPFRSTPVGQTQPVPQTQPIPQQRGYPQQGYPQQGYPQQGYAPGSAAPVYGAPGSAAPGYETPGYAAPAYGAPDSAQQPAYGQPAYGQPSGPKSGSGLKIVLWILVPLLLLGAAGVGGWYLTSGKGDKKVNNSSKPAASSPVTAPPTTPPTTPDTTPPTTPPAGNNGDALFSLPATAGGLPKSNNPALANAMSSAMAGQVPGGAAVTGVYQSPTNPTNLLVLVGVEAPIISPEIEVRGAFNGYRRSVTTSDPQSFPPGPMGGSMLCADGSVPSGPVKLPVATCIVGDNKGMMFAMFFGKKVSYAATETIQIRPTFEHA